MEICHGVVVGEEYLRLCLHLGGGSWCQCCTKIQKANYDGYWKSKNWEKLK